MPWMVTIFGIVVIPLGLVHVALVMSQPIVVHEWCTLCLVAAGIMLPMVPLEVDEVVAMGQHVKAAVRRGDRGGSAWRVFWLGGQPGDSTPDRRTPPLVDMPERPGRVIRSSVWGTTVTSNLLAGAVAGIALLVAPGVLGMGIRSGGADVAHIGGAAAVVVAVVAMAEVLRVVRYLNLATGLAVAALVWPTGASVGDSVVIAVAGAVVAATALRRGPVHETYGSRDTLVR